MPALELRPLLGWLDDPRRPPLTRPHGSGLTAKRLWNTATAGEPREFLNVEVYGMQPGGGIDPLYHDGFPTMLICWQGKGELTIAEGSSGAWNPTYEKVALQQYDCVYIEPGVLHGIKAGATLSDGRLVVLAVHALQGRPFNETHDTFGDTGHVKYDWIRNLAPGSPQAENPLYKWDPDETHRATRNRIWGRDGVGKDGESEPAKQYFHLVAYCFNPHQENPPHFHPRSFEFMLGLSGAALTYTRRKYPDRNGWDPNVREKTIRPGDTALVPMAHIHRYINETSERAIVLALQTPQPIMHTLEHEVRLFDELEA